jgi:hypothetical protein
MHEFKYFDFIQTHKYNMREERARNQRRELIKSSYKNTNLILFVQTNQVLSFFFYSEFQNLSLKTNLIIKR